MTTVASALIDAVRGAARYNPDIEEAPACILWPDGDRQWESAIPALQTVMQELLVFGEYSPEMRTGPAIWLRCAIARTLSENVIPEDATPVVYLPGISRTDLRAVSECPESLVPLVELQYRGRFWSQVNAKDWTVYAFLRSEQGGLGLDVARDNETVKAMLLALPQLLEEETRVLGGRHLDADYFNTLLTGGDPVRDLLGWLDAPEFFQKQKGEDGWKAFAQVCQSQFLFNPNKEGRLEGLRKLAEHAGNWRVVWDRFCEAPKRYQSIPRGLDDLSPGQFDMFANPEDLVGWPHYNEQQEEKLYAELKQLANMPPHEARARLQELEHEHGTRRQWVWAELDRSPLARALKHLSEMASITSNSLAVGEVEDMASAYRYSGWRADNAVLSALGEASSNRVLDAVTGAIRAVYLPWCQEAARHLQACWDPQVHGCRPRSPDRALEGQAECVLFVDGLRFDCAKRLQDRLEERGLSVSDEPKWAALPSVTGTGKYAVAPVVNDQNLKEHSAPYDFAPITAHLFKKLLKESKRQVLEKKQVEALHDLEVDTSLDTWCEYGDIDQAGHDRGWRLAEYVDKLLLEVRERIEALLSAGWETVRVVTDHGWLLMPGQLPKLELPSNLASTKWARCAVVKEGATTEERLYPWYWDNNVHFALADGVSCYKAGEEYAHGGLSLQEVYTCELLVSAPEHLRTGVTIKAIAWRGLRCSVQIEGADGLSLDVRIHAGDPASSVVQKVKAFRVDGAASVLVPDEESEGLEATVVVLDEAGNLVAQQKTQIGQD